MNTASPSSTARRCAIAALVISATVVTAAPVSAAPQGPDGNASCVAQIFVPQALGDPAAFVDKIAEVKGIAGNFGVAIGGAQGGPGLAHWPDCDPE